MQVWIYGCDLKADPLTPLPPAGSAPIPSQVGSDRAHHLAHEAAWGKLYNAQAGAGLRLPDALLPRVLVAALVEEGSEGDTSKYKSWKYPR